ncbi:MAG: AcrR family transcriptional regulator, partial [Flavobacteriaceae bacterium]
PPVTFSLMPAQTRKQRELAQRHSLFLEIGKDLLHENGFHQFSMDSVAEQAEYSKGTLYQHFSCKEELLIQLCLERMAGLHTLGEQAATYNGSHRERLLAFQIAHELWMNIEPRDIYMLQHVHADGVLNKVDEQSLLSFRKLESGIITVCASIFQDAMDDGALPTGTLNAAELVYGMWSMCYGGQLLRTFSTPLTDMGVRDPGTSITTLLQVMLNGLDWKPLMSPEETMALRDHLENEFFTDTLAHLRDGLA